MSWAKIRESARGLSNVLKGKDDAGWRIVFIDLDGSLVMNRPTTFDLGYTEEYMIDTVLESDSKERGVYIVSQHRDRKTKTLTATVNYLKARKWRRCKR